MQHSNQSIRQLEEDALLYSDVLPELTYKISSIDAGIRLAEQGYGVAFTLNSYLSTLKLSPDSIILQRRSYFKNSFLRCLPKRRRSP